LSLRRDCGLGLLNSVGTVKTLGTRGDKLMMHFLLLDSQELVEIRGGMLWFEYEMSPTWSLVGVAILEGDGNCRRWGQAGEKRFLGACF
jgi:hypothetical protein